MEDPDPGPGPSCVSLSSENSKDLIIDFKGSPSEHRNTEDPGAAPSGVSLSSDKSRDQFVDFKEDSCDQRIKNLDFPFGQNYEGQLETIFMRLEENIVRFVKEQLQRYLRALSSDHSECLLSEEDEEPSSREAFLNITLDFLRKMDQKQLAERLQNRSYPQVHRKLKSHLQQKFSCVSEGIAKAGDSTLLNHIYTELYITEGEVTGVNQEHEVRHIQTAARKTSRHETSTKCEEIFKGPIDREGPIRAELTEGHVPIRTVLTKGVAGIGKSMLTQKFSLDWAEGKANQDIQLLFPFTFRELNVLRDRQFSLVGLLQHFFSESRGLCSFQHLQVVFIFDGLDECRVPLDFTQTRVLTDPTESSSVDVLLVNLIRGSLLPSARLWITTRPAAANQIPAECVSMVTEVQGFTNPQKEQYFRKRFTNKETATAVISHIKKSRTLYIMCHIPVFCWIISTVLLHVMKTKTTDQLPQTLTQMYIHFLVVQAKLKSSKYGGCSGADAHWTPETRKMVESLGKLAFEQLPNGNLIFYESEMSDCGIDPTVASVYSGVFTQVFREEPGLYQDKVYCFIHLSVQEFLAALHVHQTFFTSRVNLLSTEQNFTTKTPESEVAFYRSAVDQALQSPNGHLDLFLRFLLGLSLPTNQSLLQGLLTYTGSEQTNQETVKYIKEKLSEGVSAERTLNLFYCLNELNDRSLVQQIQQDMTEGRLDAKQLSPADWSAVAFLLLSSDTELEEFDLKKYHPSEEVLLRLMQVVEASKKAM